jgi:hypothetical protein
MGQTVHKRLRLRVPPLQDILDLPNKNDKDWNCKREQKCTISQEVLTASTHFFSVAFL